MLTCRLLNDEAAAGPWNMAVDEMLLEQTAAGEAGLVWRFYRWTPATVSLGYFQAYDERQRHAASSECPLVRRLSGGGAILHDRELTYSLIAPANHPLARDAEHLYRAVHGALIDALAAVGIPATLNEQASGRAPDDEPFLCFERRAIGDVLLAEHKICGSAQRRSRGAILQHGSLLLDASPAAPELPGLRQLAPQPLDEPAFARRWLDTLAARLALDFAPIPLTPTEHHRVTLLAQQKFSTASWNRRR